MSTYSILQEDINLIVMQNPIKYVVRFEVMDSEGQILDEVDGIIQAGAYSISASSDVRRTVSLTVAPSQLHPHNMVFAQDGNIWLDKTVHLKIGVIDLRTGRPKFYPSGYYEYTSVDGSYDVSTNTLTVSLNDFAVMLDGTKNGQIGALTTIIPAYQEDPVTGEVIEYNYIRDAMTAVVMQLGKIKDCYIADIGESYGTERFNADYLNYRVEHPLWSSVPYDLEFGTGTSVLDIVTTLRDLYPNYETYFDPINFNTFICEQIPSCIGDPAVLSNDFMQKVVISEDTSVDMTTVKNICEVWGQIIETDFYTDDCDFYDYELKCNVAAYDEDYKNNDKIAITFHEPNGAELYLNINGFGKIPVYDKKTETFHEAGFFAGNQTHVFQIEKTRSGGTTTTRAYYIGAWQVHAIDVLVDGRPTYGNYELKDGTVVKKYSKEYFQEVYNCQTVHLTIVPDSPYTVQKIGELLDVKSGGDYDNITSDFLAEQRAIYENWKNSRLTDYITITTLLVPYYDVNTKIEYRPAREEETREYIVSDISHDFDSCTSTIQMYRFYPLYNEEEIETIGYKGFDETLTCLGYHYTVGETFLHDGKAELCEEGFHFCLDMNDVFGYYAPEHGSRYAEVKAYGPVSVSKDDTKTVCKKIEILRELSLEEARYIARKQLRERGLT